VRAGNNGQNGTGPRAVQHSDRDVIAGIRSGRHFEDPESLRTARCRRGANGKRWMSILRTGLYAQDNRNDRGRARTVHDQLLN
jgi:hypothetical protein